MLALIIVAVVVIIIIMRGPRVLIIIIMRGRWILSLELPEILPRRFLIMAGMGEERGISQQSMTISSAKECSKTLFQSFYYCN